MSNSPYVRAAIAHAALEFMPPMIRESMLNEPEFMQKYGLKKKVLLSFGDSGVGMQRTEIFDAVRQSLAGTIELEVTDADGRKWELRNEAETGQAPNLVMLSEERRLPLSGFAVLSPEVAVRLRFLNEAASDVNLPASAHDRWREILAERALEDDEVDSFHSDIHDTPVFLMRAIGSEILAGQISTSSLVPFSRRYFDRLVGAYDGSTSIRDYAAGSGGRFLKQLSAWCPYEGFLFSLFLSSHSALTVEVSVESLQGEDLARAYDFVEKHGDMLSRLGVIEIGLRILPENPRLEPVLTRFIKQIRDDDIDDSRSSFKLLAALFVLVDGGLARTRLMSMEPPFYRRLASLAQAALIHRQLTSSGIETDAFCERAFKNYSGQYYVQSFADMRLEPRWDPGLAAASQMKADFFGRIMIAADNYGENIKGSGLHDLILGTEATSIRALSEPPSPYFPGPLEGDEDSASDLPADLSKAIYAELNRSEVGPSSFTTLVNFAMIFRVKSDLAVLAAKALERGNHRLNVTDKSQLLGVLNGLATVAAVSRNRALADELRILMRRYRRDAEYGFSIQEDMRICLVAAASQADLTDWRDFTGEWLTELAFGDFKGDDGDVLYSYLQYLCHVVPELWVSCGKADAALMAYRSR